jgi:hypothetical protein
MLDERITTNIASPPVAEAPSDGFDRFDLGQTAHERALREGQPPLRLAENALRGMVDVAPPSPQAADPEAPELPAAAAETAEPRDLKTRFGNFLRKVLPGRVVEVGTDDTPDPETIKRVIAEKAEIRKLERQAEARAKQMQPVLFRQARSRLDGRPPLSRPRS